MPFTSKIEPKNNVRALGFNDNTWDKLARNKPADAFIFPFCMESTELDEESRQLDLLKIDALITLIRTYYKDTSIIFLITDTLFVHNHVNPEKAQAEADKAKQQLAEALKLPVDKLSSENRTFKHSYSLTSQFVGVESPVSDEIILSSWDNYYSTDISAFMTEVRKTLDALIKQNNADEILMDDSLLFSDQYLGFVKTKLETLLQTLEFKLRGNQSREPIPHEFLASFALTALGHLKSKFHVETELSKASTSPGHQTKTKCSLFAYLPKDSRASEFTHSLSYIIEEVLVTHDLLINSLESDMINPENIRWIFDPKVKSKVPRHHPINQLSHFIEKRKPDWRGFLRGAEFPLVCSIGERIMLKNTLTAVPVSAAQPVPSKKVETVTLQMHNGSPANSNASSNSEATKPRSNSDESAHLTADADTEGRSTRSTSRSPSENDSNSSDDDEERSKELIADRAVFHLERGKPDLADSYAMMFRYRATTKRAKPSSSGDQPNQVSPVATNNTKPQ